MFPFSSTYRRVDTPSEAAMGSTQDPVTLGFTVEFKGSLTPAAYTPGDMYLVSAKNPAVVQYLTKVGAVLIRIAEFMYRIIPLVSNSFVVIAAWRECKFRIIS